MIRKCPKCNQYTTGVINRLVYAGIAGRASAKEIEDEGAEIAQGVDGFAKNKLGKYLGSTLGKVGKGAINAASTAVGQARSLAHSVASFWIRRNTIVSNVRTKIASMNGLSLRMKPWTRQQSSMKNAPPIFLLCTAENT